MSNWYNNFLSLSNRNFTFLFFLIYFLLIFLIGMMPFSEICCVYFKREIETWCSQPENYERFCILRFKNSVCVNQKCCIYHFHEPVTAIGLLLAELNVSYDEFRQRRQKGGAYGLALPETLRISYFLPDKCIKIPSSAD